MPARLPVLFDWADPARLAPIELRRGAGALPVDAVRHVLTMLAMSSPDEPYSGVAVVREACTERSLAEFGRSLLRQWLDAGAPPRAGWVLETQALVGDDETVHQLAALIRAWAAEGGIARANAALDVFVRIGSDTALMHLHGIAEKVRTRAVRQRARQRLDDIATDLGLSGDQFADRLVPRFGLDADGTLPLDYGPRRFVVGFDEQLRPFVADEDGRRRATLPKPGVKDDPELAPAAVQRFTTLKKDVRTVAADQLHRLERAMVRQRRWSGTEFRVHVAGHPLLWHIARRLVWATFDPAGNVTGAFRLAEDRTLADADDRAVSLADDTRVGIAHPLHLGDTLQAWSELFADYALLPPFPQLDRAVHRLTAAEREAVTFDRFTGAKAMGVKLLGLERRDWRRAHVWDAAAGWIQLDLPGEPAGASVAVARIEPGLDYANPSATPEHVITEVWVSRSLVDGAGWSAAAEDRVPLGALHPVTASEIICDLEGTAP
ncbi:hypothetical protein GCM10010399_77060 [Dactylosporangium fulvum]|uniref:DUF4132 domain-containing protein n=1 Tax=Dactylosporangium fulvum TaxID=53359 RepID=UPI0031D7F73B